MSGRRIRRENERNSRLAVEMEQLAHEFATSDEALDFSLASLDRLQEIWSHAKHQQELAAIAAYLGQVEIRNSGQGQWAYGPHYALWPTRKPCIRWDLQQTKGPDVAYHCPQSILRKRSVPDGYLRQTVAALGDWVRDPSVEDPGGLGWRDKSPGQRVVMPPSSKKRS
jgi:hypothetical protein